MRLLTLCILPLCYCIPGIIGGIQTVGVKGKLLCNGKPATGVEIKLYDKGIINRMLAQVRTDVNGLFTISGSAMVVQMDPQLNIYHKCNHKGLKLFYKKRVIGIPKTYIANGNVVKKYLLINDLELAMKNKGKTTDA